MGWLSRYGIDTIHLPARLAHDWSEFTEPEDELFASVATVENKEGFLDNGWLLNWAKYHKSGTHKCMFDHYSFVLMGAYYRMWVLIIWDEYHVIVFIVLTLSKQYENITHFM